MGVRGRQKLKDTGNPWWVFISDDWKESTKQNCLTNPNNHIYLVFLFNSYQ